MQTIILAAGNNERFGGEHKSMLIAPDGRTVLENQVDIFDADPVVFIAQKKYSESLRPIISRISYENGKSRVVFHAWLEKPTRSPLDTLYHASKVFDFLEKDKPIIIAYCDILPRREDVTQFILFDKSDELDLVRGRAMVFKSDDPRFQDADIPSGEFKLSGVFCFDKASRMIKLVKELKENERGKGAGIFQLIEKLENYGQMYFQNIIDIGTPEAYEEWMKNV